MALVRCVPALVKLVEADDRGQRRALDQLHQKADGRRHRDAQGLRQDHILHLLQKVQAEAGAGLPLAARQGIDAAAPDLGEKGAGDKGERDAGGQQGRYVEAQQRQAEEHQEQLHQQRRALEQVDIEITNRGPQSSAAHSAAKQQQQRRQCRRRRRRSRDSSSGPAGRASSRNRTMSQRR